MKRLQLLADLYRSVFSLEDLTLCLVPEDAHPVPEGLPAGGAAVGPLAGMSPHVLLQRVYAREHASARGARQGRARWEGGIQVSRTALDTRVLTYVPAHRALQCKVAVSVRCVQSTAQQRLVKIVTVFPISIILAHSLRYFRFALNVSH